MNASAIKDTPTVAAPGAPAAAPLTNDQIAAALQVYAAVLADDAGPKTREAVAGIMRDAAAALLTSKGHLDGATAHADALEKTVAALEAKAGVGSSLKVLSYNWNDDHIYRVRDFREAVVAYVTQEQAAGKLTHFSVNAPDSYLTTYGFEVGIVGPPQEVERIHTQLKLMWKAVG